MGTVHRLDEGKVIRRFREVRERLRLPIPTEARLYVQYRRYGQVWCYELHARRAGQALWVRVWDPDRFTTRSSKAIADEVRKFFASEKPHEVIEFGLRPIDVPPGSTRDTIKEALSYLQKIICITVN